ncbi:ZIP family metal transporter [Candidatus Saccharibacteria bacterium]|jgi:zinc and cadmium transporter|nr:ZIP family metal transporter [Candidatus Saccharibacteria bacterium]HOR23398.1 ZIP family metal transporter [Candidatus Saccharibacteria bacterium]HPW47764.1 ZIP family metal transporter [Candidatus Saccharibacteria bacterium]
MQAFWQILILSLLGSLTAWLVAVFFIGNKNTSKILAGYATPFAAGAFLATVFFDLLPEGLEQGQINKVLTSVLIGLVVFFYLERFLRWFHFHSHKHKQSKNKLGSVTLIVITDTLHNMLDGVAIATAFLVSLPLGVVMVLAIVAHEIPQTLSIFGLMLSMKVKKLSILTINLCSSLTTVPVAIFTYWMGSASRLPLGVLLGLSAGFLLYLATADIIPTIHEDTDKRPLHDIRPVILLFGIVTVYVLIKIVNKFA